MNTPKLPFYAVVLIIIIVNVLQFILKYLSGIADIVVNALLIAATTFAFEYGVSTSVQQASLPSNSQGV